eukprot:CAMPEP_0115000896 /NCGR_PEP_ID=MMETSP0216-20121206/17039_1 /TAXON_ID=223996 /ORGANISM="Protocruzia adherens, Strain Boccale" /LENGTH=316 /DNA_ID=CAMNT_0002366099 /DNA_START=70 /DNA_END=1020 /DNA_ORIENTATION=+
MRLRAGSQRGRSTSSRNNKVVRLRDPSEFKDDKFRLYNVDEIKNSKSFSYLVEPYITEGYRANLSPWTAWRSIFRMHNETTNVWTHMIPGFYYFYALIKDLFFSDADWDDRLHIAAFLVAVIICMWASSTFHTVSCCSHRTFQKAHTMDVCGIMLVISTSTIVSVIYGFSCFPSYAWIYSAIMAVIAVILIALPFSGRFMRKEFRLIRSLLYAGSVCYGASLVPVMFYHNTYEANTQVIYMKVLMLGSYGMGFVFFLTRWPEKFSKARWAQVWFHSHTIWHLWVFLGTYLSYVSLTNMLEYYHDDYCKSIEDYWTT